MKEILIDKHNLIGLDNVDRSITEGIEYISVKVTEVLSGYSPKNRTVVLV